MLSFEITRGMRRIITQGFSHVRYLSLKEIPKIEVFVGSLPIRQTAKSSRTFLIVALLFTQQFTQHSFDFYFLPTKYIKYSNSGQRLQASKDPINKVLLQFSASALCYVYAIDLNFT